MVRSIFCEKNLKPPTKDPTDRAVTAVRSCSLAVTAGAVAASQHAGDDWGAMVLPLFLHSVVLLFGIPGPLLDPKLCTEKPSCTRSAFLGLVSFNV